MRGWILAAVLAASPAAAHDKWSNGEDVPDWVKKWCCSKSDVHQVNPSAIHIMPDGYHVDGLSTVIPMSRAMPSPDGKYWIFFKEELLPDAPVYCMYAPLNGV